MKPFRILLAVLAVVGLAGCYTSEKPLVTDDTSVTPYSKITFYNEDNKPLPYTVEAKHYTTTGDDGQVSYLHLQLVENNDYVAQMSSGDMTDTNGPQILYGYMRLDAAGGKAQIWKMVGTSADVRPGLRECKDVICIDDLAAYIAYAKETIAAGGKPDAEIKVEVVQ